MSRVVNALRSLTQIRIERAELLFVLSILRRDRRALGFTLAGCTISAAVAVFQFAVFTSFLRAAAVVPSVVGASAWVMGYGVPAFDFPYLISQDYAGLIARCFPGASIDRVLFGFGEWTSPLGRHGNVAVVGLEETGAPPRSFIVDLSDRDRLDLHGTRRVAEIGGLRMSLARFDHRLATFLGSPYAIVSLSDAARALRAPPDRVSFLAIHAAESSSSLDHQILCAQALYPELTVTSAKDFRRSSAWYWATKSGAGAAILIASALASVLLSIILTNGIGRFCQRRHHDLMSMLSIGAAIGSVAGILLCVVCIFAFGSMGVALVLLPLVDIATEPFVPWVEIKVIDVIFALAITGAGAVAGFVTVFLQVKRFEVSDVFRAS